MNIKGQEYRVDDRLRGVVILLGPLDYSNTKNRHYRCQFCAGRVRRYNDKIDPLRCKNEECRTLQSMADKPERMWWWDIAGMVTGEWSEE